MKTYKVKFLINYQKGKKIEPANIVWWEGEASSQVHARLKALEANPQFNNSQIVFVGEK